MIVEVDQLKDGEIAVELLYLASAVTLTGFHLLCFIHVAAYVQLDFAIDVATYQPPPADPAGQVTSLDLIFNVEWRCCRAPAQ